jgi:hypothetical protein
LKYRDFTDAVFAVDAWFQLVVVIATMAAVREAAGLTVMVDQLNPQVLSEWLAGMSLPERARALNRIAHGLTICTREFEAATQPFKDPALVIKRLIGLSELQHQLSAQIGHYMDGEEIKVYPMDVFAQILFEKAIQYQILPFLRGAVNRIKTGM